MERRRASLSTRDTAKALARDAEREGSTAVDLTGVEFVSRAFADELVTQAEERDLDIVGGDDDVRKMLSVVGYSE